MLLGKRKRRVSTGETEPRHSDDRVEESDRYHALLKKHFEAVYEPIEESHPSAKDQVNGDNSEDESSNNDWAGFSDDDDDDGDESVSEDASVLIVDHSAGAEDAQDETSIGSRRSLTAAGKLSGDDALNALRNVKAVPEGKDATSETSLLKNDMALQRLLRESRLLSSESATQDRASLRLTGKNRHQALDAQLRSLGAKTSIHAQKNMPRSQRMGITRAAVAKETTRRMEAKEAGIVLEKERRAPRNAKRRDRGVGAPSIGKFRGGTLTLSAKDIRSIQGPPAKRRGKKGR